MTVLVCLMRATLSSGTSDSTTSEVVCMWGWCLPEDWDFFEATETMGSLHWF